jgi:hypothetical protein
MSISDLASKLHAALSGVITVESDAQLQNCCTAIATAIVDEIQDNALVTGEVTSGAGAGGVVTGTVS